MAIKNLPGRVLNVIFLLALGVFLTVETASGAAYRIRYHPLFGDPYPNLGFSGVAEFEIDDACLREVGWIADGNSDTGCGAMSLISATVELWNEASSPDTVDTLTFAPPVPDPDPILGVFVAFSSETGRNEVIGLDTSIFGPQAANVPGAYIGPLWLQFMSGQMGVNGDQTVALLADVSTSSLLTDVNAAFLYAATNCPTGQEEPSYRYTSSGYYPQPQECSTTPDNQSNPATDITFERLAVPEPGSLALIIGALGAGWLARRKMRKA